MAARNAFLLAGLLSLTPIFGYGAQTPELAAGDSPPIPIAPLEFMPLQYPIEALLAAEEGDVSFSLVIDPEGKVVRVFQGASSGSDRLDTQAHSIAYQWRFTPAMHQGRPVYASYDVKGSWKLPLESAEAFLLPEDTDMPEEAFEQNGSPPRRIDGARPRAADYPSNSVQLGEQGEVIAKALISDVGTVASVLVVDSSGFQRLDDAAVSYINRRYRYEPGKINGRPVPMWIVTRITFRLYEGDGRFCHFKPFAERNARRMAGMDEEVVKTSPWYLINADGTIGELLMLTEDGWMKWSQPMVARLNEGRRRTRPPVLRGERRLCWVDNTITVDAAGAN
jgi:TonB family protein